MTKIARTLTSRSVGGIRFTLKLSHDGLAAVMDEKTRQQGYRYTQWQAARDLGISVSTFRNMVYLNWDPSLLHTPRGKILAGRIEDWSGFGAECFFPEAFFTKEFMDMPRTFTKKVPFELRMFVGSNNGFKALTAGMTAQSTKSHSRKKGRRERK